MKHEIRGPQNFSLAQLILLFADNEFTPLAWDFNMLATNLKFNSITHYCIHKTPSTKCLNKSKILLEAKNTFHSHCTCVYVLFDMKISEPIGNTAYHRFPGDFTSL